VLTARGAIGAWIKNVELPPDEAIDTRDEGLDLAQLEKLSMETSHGEA
jgi:hypothetical protein